jgi:hypothetical protein
MHRHRLTVIFCFALCLTPAALAGLTNNPWVVAFGLLWPFALAGALALTLVLGALLN